MAHFVYMAPKIEEQRWIAREIDLEVSRLDHAISLIEEQVSTLEAYRRSLIQEVVTKGLDSGVPMKDSGIEWIGPIPEHWSTNRLKNICKRVFDGPFGSLLTGDDYSDEGIRVVRLENLKYLYFDDSKESYVSEEKYKEISAHTVYPSDLIMATFVEDRISVCILPEDIGFAVNKSDCVGIRLDGSCLQKYLHYYLSSLSTWSFLRSQLHGATRGRVNTTQIKSIPVVIPSLEEQRLIAEYLEERMRLIDQAVDKKSQQLDTLYQQRQSLIYEYVTGKRRVEEVCNG